MRSPSIAAVEIERLLSARPLRLAAAVVCLVPLLYGVLYLWAFWNPYQRLDKLPVAVVNLDRPVTTGGATVNVGRDLTRQLRGSDSFAWHVTSAAQAKQGLEDGTYYMALTIPADFSGRLAHAGDAGARPGELRVTANEARNLLASQIGSRVFLELRASLTAVTTRGYLDRHLREPRRHARGHEPRGARRGAAGGRAAPRRTRLGRARRAAP